jgi:Zn-dependent peptidase ImmA (M78 family)
MMDDELKAIAQAWAFQKEAGITARPVSIDKYLRAVSAELKVVDYLNDDEDGQVMKVGDRVIIAINGRQSPERQRFTVLHEIAHIRLDLPSVHGIYTSAEQFQGRTKRPKEEILCDVFAAECLLPRHLFQADIQSRDCSFATIQELAELYNSSLAATGSRFAAYSTAACCWVLSDDKRVRYASCSPTLRSVGFFLRSGVEIPKTSVLGRLWAGSADVQPSVPRLVSAETWIHNDCESVDEFSETAAISAQTNQGVALLVAELAAIDIKDRHSKLEEEEDVLLPELDGQLRFPRKRRRR